MNDVVPRTKPFEFNKLGTAKDCCVCGTQKSVHYQSDYPSPVKPFAEQIILYCIDCGSGFVPESAEMLKKYYSVDYATLNRGDRDIEPDRYFSPEYRTASPKIARYFVRASRHVELLHAVNAKLGNVLDYGSGPGYFLFVSRAQNKFAFEPDTKSAKYLSHIGATQFSTLDQIASTQFDAIVASHSMEHLVPEELSRTLQLLVGQLNNEGKLLIEVPHGGHSYIQIDAQQDPHTIFFTPEGLVRAVEAAGGRVLYNHAMAKPVAPARKDAIYRPGDDRHFYSERRGALTVICEKR